MSYRNRYRDPQQSKLGEVCPWCDSSDAVFASNSGGCKCETCLNTFPTQASRVSKANTRILGKLSAQRVREQDKLCKAHPSPHFQFRVAPEPCGGWYKPSSKWHEKALAKLKDVTGGAGIARW